MDASQLVEAFSRDIASSLWPAFGPEIVLCATILLILIVRTITWGSRLQKGDAFVVAIAGVLYALILAGPWHHLSEGGGVERRELFTGMLVLDNFTVYLRSVLLLFALLLTVLMWMTNTPPREDGADVLCLVLGATLGMLLMASANHLLMVFLAIEMASVPSYALAGVLRHRRDSSEAALKYSVYGAGAAGVMLYGISLLAGLVNTAHLPTVAQRLVTQLPTMDGSELLVMALAGLMIMAGLAFKLSAVPFHFWCPDVFHGASAEVNAFLSVASKAAALALLVRVSLGVATIPGGEAVGEPVAATAAGQVERAAADQPLDVAPLPATLYVAQDASAAETAASSPNPLAPVQSYVVLLVGTLAAITCTFGNLAAYAQTNMKRLMAYSTIAHAGYMMMPVPAAVALADVDPQAAVGAIAALAFYIFIYLFMNLGGFAMIAFLRDWLGSEEIADYAGLVRRSPTMVVLMGTVMFSLVGLPPLAGFVGKFAIFASLFQAYRATDGNFFLALLFIGAVNTAISLFYYLRVVKVMAMEPEAEAVAARVAPISFLRAAMAVALVVPIFVFGVFWNKIFEFSESAASQLF